MHMEICWRLCLCVCVHWMRSVSPSCRRISCRRILWQMCRGNAMHKVSLPLSNYIEMHRSIWIRFGRARACTTLSMCVCVCNAYTNLLIRRVCAAAWGRALSVVVPLSPLKQSSAAFISCCLQRSTQFPTIDLIPIGKHAAAFVCQCWPYLPIL